MTTAFDGGKFDGFCVWTDTVAPATLSSGFKSFVPVWVFYLN